MAWDDLGEVVTGGIALGAGLVIAKKVMEGLDDLKLKKDGSKSNKPSWRL